MSDGLFSGHRPHRPADTDDPPTSGVTDRGAEVATEPDDPGSPRTDPAEGPTGDPAPDEPADLADPRPVDETVMVGVPDVDEPSADEPPADEPAADEPAADEPSPESPPTDGPDAETSAGSDTTRPVSWRDEVDRDATTVIPLAAVTARSPGPARHDTPTDVWDTGTIRRWDPSMTDNRTRTADSAMDRPQPLDDRDDVSLDHEEEGGRWYEVPLMIIIALTLAFLLRTFVVQVFYIPSGSMIPTLEVYDRIAVEKLSYLAREPERGEVVVFAGDDPFAEPDDSSTADRVMMGVGQFLGVVPVDAKDFVKRVIGLPGDTVVMTDGVVTVNGVELDEPYARLDQDNGEWTVPDGSLFVMGDNRGNSGDSRSSLGFIPIDDVVGRAVVTIWPFERAGSIPGVDHGAAVDAGS